jgi:hypothetical protein
MLQFFKKNNFLFGLGTGLLVPFPVLGFFWLLDFLMKQTGIWHGLHQPQNILLLSLVGNLVLIRIYFINLKSDKTAKGILLMTLVYVVIFFLVYYHRV